MTHMRTKAVIIAGLLMITSNVNAVSHTVVPGDTPWNIGQRYKVDFKTVLENNNLTENSVIMPGQVLKISDDTKKEKNTTTPLSHTVAPGDTPWNISQRYGVEMKTILENNKLTESSVITPGQVLHISGEIVSMPFNNTRSHKVSQGDTLWNISQKHLVTIQDIISINPGLTESTQLELGRVIKIPSEFVVDTSKVDSKHGAYLDWWTQVNKALPIGATFKVIDYYTGKSFNIKRTIGANHADVEPLTKADVEVMKSIWGKFTWVTRPTIVEYKGMRIASSMSFMPHAGNDVGVGGQHTDWRSGNYGAGPNLDYIKGNGMDGHLDLYFNNCTRHVDGKPDVNHQNSVKIAAGIK